MSNIIVRLSPKELRYAKSIGLKRNSINRSAGQSDGCVMDSVEIDVAGAQAEYAVAKAFDLEWSGKLFEHEDWQIWRDQGHDVGPLEVRSTNHPKGRLILHPSDKDLSPFVLVRSNNSPEFNIVGWQWAIGGKKHEYWHDVGYGRPCYYVPNNRLRDIGELKSRFVK